MQDAELTLEGVHIYIHIHSTAAGYGEFSKPPTLILIRQRRLPSLHLLAGSTRRTGREWK